MLLSGLVLVAVLSLANGQCTDSQLNVGVFFSCQLDNHFSSDTPVRVMAKQEGVAGLPEWLSVSQFNSTSPVFIHGTPTEEGTLTLRVTVLSGVTFESVTRKFKLTVSRLGGDILQEYELYITNFELVEFLSSEIQSSFHLTLNLAYASVSDMNPILLRVIHPSSQGIPVPLPPAKHGVIVYVSPGVDVPPSSPSTCQSSFTQVFTNRGFELNSCTAMSIPSSTNSSPMPGAPEEERTPPPSSGSGLTFIIILVVCVVVTFMMVTGLAVVLCGGRKGGYTVTEGKKARLSMMHDISKDTSKGPVSAQTCLRDLARPVEHPPAAVRRREGPERPRSEALLEYHDLTDYVGTPSTSDPPPYTYPNISYSSSSAVAI